MKIHLSSFASARCLSMACSAFICLAASSADGGSVVINEVMAANGQTLADENGDFEDWIELMNTGPEPVRLDGWGLSDDANSPFKWVFAEGVLQPGEFVTVFASGKDRQPQTPTPREPTQIPGLQVWLSALAVDPEDPLQVRHTEDGRSFVLQWMDQSGNGHHALQDDPEKQPLWREPESGRPPVLAFDGVNDQLVLPRVLATNDFCLFAVFRTSRSHEIDGELVNYGAGAAGQNYLFGALYGGTDFAGAGVSVGTNGASVYEHASGYMPAVAVLESPLGSEHLILAVNYRAKQASIDVQGQLGRTGQPSARPAIWAPRVIGSGAYGQFQGDLTEVLIFDRALEETERSALARHLELAHEIPVPRIRHTNFRLDNTAGETLQLTRPDGSKSDDADLASMPRDVSWGRQADGSGAWSFFLEATPGATNAANGYAAPLAPPAFSRVGGFHADSFMLSLSADDPGAAILYTLDGSEPDPANLDGRTYHYKNQYPEEPGDPFGPLLAASLETLQYEGPIEITDRSGEPDRLTGRSTTWHSSPDAYTPLEPVFKGTVVRARTVKAGSLPSEVATQTYFITPAGQGRYSVPVVSLSIDEDLLFDYERGIHCAGIDYDAWRTDYPDTNGVWRSPSRPANYHRDGQQWEYPVGFEVFGGTDQPALNTLAGLRIHGRDSRSFPQKNLRLHAREQDGAQCTFDHAFFPAGSNRLDETAFGQSARVLLQSGSKYLDVVAHAIMAPAAIEVQRSQPVVSFINGEYWGLGYFRDKQDEHYLASKYAADPGNFIILNAPFGFGKSSDVEVGIPADILLYREMFEYATQGDPGSEDYYGRIDSWMDLESYMDFNIMLIYLNSNAWQGAQHFRFWRVRQPGDLPGADGKWRMMVWDLDWFVNVPAYDFLASALHPQGEAMDGWARFGGDPMRTLLLRRLVDNPEFRTRFINRFAFHLNSTLRPERIADLANFESGRISAECPEHVARWNGQTLRELGLVENWCWFARNRPWHMQQHIRTHLGAGSGRAIAFDVNDIRQGHLRVDGLDIRPGTPGIPDEPYPWTGTYFGGVPITVEALPAPGFRFLGWEGLSGQATSKVVVDPADLGQLVARFEPKPEPATIHYWNFNAADQLGVVTHTFGGALLSVEAGLATGWIADSAEGFQGSNARMDDPAGTHFRVNNPLGSTLTFRLPTTGFTEVVVAYETRRSGQGAGVQRIACTTNGVDFVEFAEVEVFDADPQVVRLDFSAVEMAADNPGFGLRITFAPGTGGIAGNNRFDNFTVEGQATGGVNFPTRPRPNLASRELIQGTAPILLDLHGLFINPDNDSLKFHVESSRPEVAGLRQTAYLTEITAGQPGEAWVTVTADDEHHPAVSATFLVSVHPEAHRLADGDFIFDAWNPGQPAGTYPAHMVFGQTATSDPGLNAVMDSLWAQPYDLNSRSRINGLGEYGVSFINTANAQDAPGAGYVGSALVALHTVGLDEVWVAWTGGTLVANERVQALRLQYRLGTDGAWTEAPDADGEPLEYQRNPISGHSERLGPVRLPAEVAGREYVQLRWKYHHVSGDDGPRAQLRLDDVIVSGGAPPSPEPNPAPWNLAEGPYEFGQWPSESPAGTYPPHMVFEQAEAGDPGLEAEMTARWTLPYDLESRSRINGLGDLGVAFLNTSNPQETSGAGFAGSALVALRTVDLDEVWISWTAGTVAPNERVYALRLQYRVGDVGPWSDVPDEVGNPVEYLRHPSPGHTQRLRPVRLPEAAAGQEYVQVRWKYYHVSGDDGSRAQLRLDNVVIGREPLGPVDPPVAWGQPEPVLYGTVLGEGQLGAVAEAAGSFTYHPPAGTRLPVGTHSLEATFTPEDLVTYNILSISVTLRVDPAPLKVLAVNAARSYGGDNPPLTYRVEGLVYDETPDIVTGVVLRTAADAQSDAGCHPINAEGGSAPNYTVSHYGGLLNVHPAVPAVQWSEPLAVTYGSPLAEGQLGATAALPGTFAYHPPAGVVLPAGEHRLEAIFTPEDAVNHAVATVHAMVTVRPAPLTVRAVNQVRPYRAQNPELTFELEGLVNGDHPDVLVGMTANTTATVDSPTGTYPITAGGGTAINYVVASLEGVLTIEPAVPGITWAGPGSIVHGTPLGEVQLNAQTEVAGSFSYDPPAGTLLSEGEHRLEATFTPEDTLNYTSAVAQAVVTVTSAPPEITLQPAGQVVARGKPVTFQVEATSVGSPAYQWLKDGEAISGAVDAVLDIERAQVADAGTYQVIVTSAEGRTESEAVQLSVFEVRLQAAGYIRQAAVTIAGSINNRYRIEYTDCLTPPIQWQPTDPVQLDEPTLQVTDTTTTYQTLRFYRVVFLEDEP